MDVKIAKDNMLTLPPTATPEHRVLMSDGSWRPFKDLKVGDQIQNVNGAVRIEEEFPQWHGLDRH